MLVDLLLSCMHFDTIEIESVLNLPKEGSIHSCSQCREQVEIINVSNPYRNPNEIKSGDGQTSMVEE